MRFFGNFLEPKVSLKYLNKINFFSILIILVYPFFIQAEPVFRLSKNEILKGEPLTAQFEFKGGADIKVPKNIISNNNVTAEYIGTEESVSIINMNVTRKKIVKFRIVTSKDGNLKTPDIIVESEGKEIHSGEENFTVSKEKYVPKNNWFDFGEDIFGGVFFLLKMGKILFNSELLGAVCFTSNFGNIFFCFYCGEDLFF
jgi:hypothetical protein